MPTKFRIVRFFIRCILQFLLINFSWASTKSTSNTNLIDYNKVTPLNTEKQFNIEKSLNSNNVISYDEKMDSRENITISEVHDYWKRYMSPVEYQIHNNCGVHAATGVVEGLLHKYIEQEYGLNLAGTGLYINLDEDRLYSWEIDPENVLNWLANGSFAHSEEASLPTFPNFSEACWSISSTSFYGWDTIEQIKANLESSPIACSINFNRVSFDNYPGGIYICTGPTGIETRHAVVIVGWGKENGIEYWIMKNSFGTNWGEEGYFKYMINIDRDENIWNSTFDFSSATIDSKICLAKIVPEFFPTVKEACSSLRASQNRECIIVDKEIEISENTVIPSTSNLFITEDILILSGNSLSIDYSTVNFSSFGNHDYMYPTIIIEQNARFYDSVYSYYQPHKLVVDLCAVLTPNGGEIWSSGSTKEIKWKKESFGQKVNLDISYSNGDVWYKIIENLDNNGSYFWDIPESNNQSDNCLIRVSECEWSSIVYDISDNVFSIIPPQIRITSPAAGDIWKSGTLQTIEWVSQVNIETVTIEYTYDETFNIKPIAYNIPNMGSYTWTVPIECSELCQVRVWDNVYSTLWDNSDTFTIWNGNLPPKSWIDTPFSGEIFTEHSDIPIHARAHDGDGQIVSVDLYIDGQLHATDTTSPFDFTYADATVGTHLLKVIATDDGMQTTESNVTSITVIPPSACSDDFNDDMLEIKWRSVNLGLACNGITAESNGEMQITVGETGSGNGIWSTSDQCRYVYQSIKSDYLDVKLEIMETPISRSWATTGLMFRKALASGSAHVSVLMTEDYGLRARMRMTDNGATTDTAVVSMTKPRWVRIVKDNSTFSCYYQDAEGLWQPLGGPIQMNDMAGEVLVGVAVAANQETPETGKVDNFIVSNVRTYPPAVAITHPVQGAEYPIGSDVTISAAASDSNGTVLRVEFFVDGGKIGEDSSSPYSIVWPNAPAWSHTLTAKATDNDSMMTLSPAISVVGGTNYSDNFDDNTLATKWTSVNYGLATGGGTTESGAMLNITEGEGGNGDGIWGVADNCRYVYQTIKSSCMDIVLKVNSTPQSRVWATTGLMVRKSNTAASAQVSALLTKGNGVRFRIRPTDGSVTADNTSWPMAAPKWVRLMKNGNTYTSYYSADGSSWTRLGSMDVSLTDSVLVGITVAANQLTAETGQVDDFTVEIASTPLTPPELNYNDDFADNSLNVKWTSTNMGLATGGGTTESGGTLNISEGEGGNGDGICGVADNCRYVYQRVTENVLDIRLKVNETPYSRSWATTGLMIRKSSAAGSAEVSALMTRWNGLRFRIRSTDNGSTVDFANASMTVPKWVRLVKDGNTFTCYYSADGNSWTQLGATAQVILPATVLVGAAVAANQLTPETGKVDDFTVFTSVLPKLSDEEAIASDVLPQAYQLRQNWPNPFNPATNLSFDLPTAGHVRIVVYDKLGREVKTLVNGNMEAGRHEVIWDSRNNRGDIIASDVYFVRMKAGDYTETKKVIFIK